MISRAFAVFIPVLFYICFFIAMFVLIVSSQKRRKRLMQSSDGHFVKPEENLTCEANDNHHHKASTEFGERYIVHNEPSLGYVTLNGVLRKIEDCKDL